MDLELKDKVAVITGASLGIGLAVAEALAQEGVHVALCGRDENRILETAKAISNKHAVKAIGIAADVSVAADVDRFLAEVAKTFDGVDILINNAGTGGGETILEAPDEKWQHYWDLHVMAAIRLARGLAPSMRRRGGGVILNNASICSLQPSDYEPVYNVTKAALAMLSKCMANEFIQYNIRVNTVNPGLIMTPDWVKTAKMLSQDTDTTWEGYLEQVAKDNTPIGRFATPEELANFFVFLCSPRASYCVGSAYFVDGGWLKVVN
jgi:NAD(P)-dependent dehydrogenase (short-subunit alcohol dehydrogenase family)